jgi:transcriptional regulator with XRE-family HTH domain
MTISERNRMIRQKRKLSQTELADMLDLNFKSISFYELGSSNCASECLKTIGRCPACFY